MTRNFTADLDRLQKFAFSRAAETVATAERFQNSSKLIDRHPLSSEIWNLYAWLLAPYSLWPIECGSIAEEILSSLRSRTGLDEFQELLLKTLDRAPEPARVERIAAFEHTVQAGTYGVLVKQWEKYEETSARLIADPERENAWRQIKLQFSVERFQNKRGVIRRTMIMERNLRQRPDAKLSPESGRFQAAFDSMCHRWQLYGMEYDKPLPLMLTVNPTPHGLLLMIPRLWSLDVKRDIDWAFVHRLHQSYGAHKQGPKLSKARQEIDDEAKQVFMLSVEARNLGLRGTRRMEFILTRLGKSPSTDESWIKRRLRKGKQYFLKVPSDVARRA